MMEPGRLSEGPARKVEEDLETPRRAEYASLPMKR